MLELAKFAFQKKLEWRFFHVDIWCRVLTVSHLSQHVQCVASHFLPQCVSSCHKFVNLSSMLDLVTTKHSFSISSSTSACKKCVSLRSHSGDGCVAIKRNVNVDVFVKAVTYSSLMVYCKKRLFVLYVLKILYILFTLWQRLLRRIHIQLLWNYFIFYYTGCCLAGADYSQCLLSVLVKTTCYLWEEFWISFLKVCTFWAYETGILVQKWEVLWR